MREQLPIEKSGKPWALQSRKPGAGRGKLGVKQKIKKLKSDYNVPMELEDKVYEMDPNTSISTGLDSDEGDTDLNIYYINGKTIVKPSSDVNPSEIYMFHSKVSPREVLKEYLSSI